MVESDSPTTTKGPFVENYPCGFVPNTELTTLVVCLPTNNRKCQVPIDSGPVLTYSVAEHCGHWHCVVVEHQTHD